MKTKFLNVILFMSASITIYYIYTTLLTPTDLSFFEARMYQNLKTNRDFKVLEQASQNISSHALTSNLALRGLYHVPEQFLYNYNTMFVNLLDVIPDGACAGLFNKQKSYESWQEALKYLKYEQLDFWFRIKERAIIAGLNNPSVTQINEYRLQTAYRNIRNRLEHIEQLQLDNYFNSYLNNQPLEESQACWALNIIVRGAQDLEAQDRHTLINGLELGI